MDMVEAGYKSDRQTLFCKIGGEELEERDFKKILNIWRGLAIALLVALIGTGLYSYKIFNEKNQYSTLLQNQYQRAFRDLVTDVENVKILLDKAEVTASTVQSNTLMTQLWQNGHSATQNLGLLPITQGVLSNTEKFLNQLSDFSFSLSKQNAGNKLMSGEQKNQLVQLASYSANLVNELRLMQQDINKDKIKFGEIAKKGVFYMKKASENVADTKFGGLEKQFTDYPAMIYDGPFSDNVIEGKPKDLENEKEVDFKTAEDKVKEFIGAEKVGKITEISSGKGAINTFGLEVEPPNGDKSKSIFIDITKKGGHVLWMLDPRMVTEKKLTDEEASNKAKEFLKTQDFGNLEETFYYKNDNTITVTYVALENNDVLVYPDQMKVKVALDNGEIVGFDAYQYLMAHRQRNITEPTITEAEARAKVATNLEINRVKLTIIPLPGDREQLCYEFKGKYKDNDYFIYINAENGNEENILRIIKEENGILTQ